MCHVSFTCERNIKAAANKYDEEGDDKVPLNYVIRSIRNEPEKVWSCQELLHFYIEKGGTDRHITRFTNRLKTFLRNEVYSFESPGVSTVIMHQKKASMLFKVVKIEKEEEECDNTEKELSVVAEKIKSELKKIGSLDKTYPVLNDETLVKSCSDTLQSLFLSISPKFQDQLKIVSLVSSILNTVVNGRTSMLQVALSGLVREKKIIEHLHEYAVTSTYKEYRRFRVSAASSNEVQVQLESCDGLIQGVSDNFDAALSTQNGLKQTHSLATIIIQNGDYLSHRFPIPRLTRSECSTIPLEETD